MAYTYITGTQFNAALALRLQDTGNFLVDVCPKSSNIPDGSLTDLVFVREFFVAFFRASYIYDRIPRKRARRRDSSFKDFRHSPSPFRSANVVLPTSVFKGMSDILLMRYILQIIKAIIESIAVLVINFMSCGSWTEKYFCHQGMYQHKTSARCFSEVNNTITNTLVNMPFEDYSAVVASLRTAHQSTVRRNPISIGIRYNSPFFNMLAVDRGI